MMMMTAFFPADRMMSKAEAVSALGRAKTGTLEYYSAQPVLPTAAKLRDLSALEAMYAYFGSDEA